MKIQNVKINGIAREDLIVLLEESGDWSIITTIPAVESYFSPFAEKDDVGLICQGEKVIANEDDVRFLGGPYEYVFNFKDV